jgi:DNA-binding IclR family transcriptional regulator
MGIGASSIAMLAKMPAKQVNRIISANCERYREFGNLTDEKIIRLVQDAGERGYAVFDRRAGMIFTAVGLAVIDRRNEIVAGLGVSAIHSRMNTERRESVVSVMRAALEEVHYGF